jgi:hypothetical protein
MTSLPRPCLDCHTLTTATRCEKCALGKARQWDAARDPATRTHYSGDYQRRAKVVRETPGPCWICGEWDRPGDPWNADHLEAGNVDSVLLKAHRSCNIRRAARPGKQAGDGGKPV